MGFVGRPESLLRSRHESLMGTTGPARRARLSRGSARTAEAAELGQFTDKSRVAGSPADSWTPGCVDPLPRNRDPPARADQVQRAACSSCAAEAAARRVPLKRQSSTSVY